MTMDLVVNIVLVLFIKSNLAILYMSNIGTYSRMCSRCRASCCCGATGRTGRDRSRSALAGCRSRRSCACSTLYSSWSERSRPSSTATGPGPISRSASESWGSLLLFIYRRVVEDREGVHLREEVPLVPGDAEMQAITGSPVPAG